jgi:uncharacterized protein (TIGR03435 family)
MNPWIAIVAWTLIHFLWQGALITVAAAVILRLARTASPQIRYGAACAGLTAMVTAPLVTAAALASAWAPAGSAVPPLAAGLDVVRVAAGRTVQVPLAGVAHWWTTVDAASFLLLVVIGWSIGVAALLVRLALGWWRLRTLHQAALRTSPSSWQATSDSLLVRLRLRRTVRVINSTAIDTPAVIGWLRPVVLLPIAALANLSEEQVVAILVHELAHIRRHDIAVNACQAVAETLLFYHPGVWWLSSCIRAEREHCCDDVAVAVSGDPVVYAEALTALASWSMATPPLVVGAGGGSLLERVRRVLGMEATARRRTSTTSLVALLTVAALGAGGLTALVRAQVPDVMRLVHAGGPGIGVGPRDVNRMLGYELFPAPRAFPGEDPRGARAWDVTVKYPGREMPFIGFTGRGLIRYAYGASSLPVVDVPAWIDNESVSMTAETAALDEATLRAAVRSAFEQQLQLVTRHDSRDFDAYALVLADNGLGPNIHPATSTCIDDAAMAAAAMQRQQPVQGQRTAVCGINNGLTGPTGSRVTMAEIARELRHPWVDREVVDRTGLTGAFDYTLRLGAVPLAVIATAHFRLARLLAPLGVTAMAQALEEQLGLKLEPATMPFDVLVVERVEKP